MNKTFLLNADVRSATFLAAPSSVRGHWIALQAYCSERETGGLIAGAKNFSGGHWTMIMGSGGSKTAVEKLVASGFASWSGDDLRVSWYHLESEVRYQDQRARASLGGRAKAEKQRELRIQSQPGDSDGDQASNGTAVGPAPATSPEREGPESWVRGRGGREGEAADGSVEAFDPTGPVRNEADAVALFEQLFFSIHRTAYKRSPADTMALRTRWDELDLAELAERLTTYVNRTPGSEATIVAFLQWCLGPSGPSQIRGGRR